MEEIRNMSLFGRLPRKLRIILIILSILTIVYWAIWLFIKLWNLIGFCLHWITYNEPNKRNWWIYTTCILLIVIGGLIVAEMCSDLDPFTNLYNKIQEAIDEIRDLLAQKIRG